MTWDKLKEINFDKAARFGCHLLKRLSSTFWRFYPDIHDQNKPFFHLQVIFEFILIQVDKTIPLCVFSGRR